MNLGKEEVEQSAFVGVDGFRRDAVSTIDFLYLLLEVDRPCLAVQLSNASEGEKATLWSVRLAFDAHL